MNDFCDAADLAANLDPVPFGIVTAAIALVTVDAAGAYRGSRHNLASVL